ncbi:MAG: VOC family protein [Pseudomonadota bacterium]
MTPGLDHLVLGCLSLEDARPTLEAAFGLPAQGGGAHVGRGTHNALWGLDGGPRGPVYLELIAPDPAQDIPEGRPLPFGLHLSEMRARLAGGPRLIAWVARCDDIEARAPRSPVPLGAPQEMRRGNLAWRLTVTKTGATPCEGIVPALIQWPAEAATPSEAMAGSGLRLTDFRRRPDPEAASALEALGLAGALPEGDTAGRPLRAVIEGPAGPVTLE